MSIVAIQDAKILRAEGKRLNREGLSKRVHFLVGEYFKKWPEGNYQEAIELAGRLHAISLASRFDTYWREKSERGFQDEFYEIQGVKP